MDLPVTSGAALVALVAAALFALIVQSWRVAGDRQSGRPAFAGVIMNEAAQRVGDRWQQLRRDAAAWLATFVVFAFAFAIAAALQQEPLLYELATWQQLLVLLGAGLALGAGVYRFVRLLALRHRLRLKKDAGKVTGHALQRLNANLNRAFHDVPCSAGIIDHVVAGLHGIYAIHVIARPPGKDNRVRLKDDAVHFASRHGPVAIGAFLAAAERLARDCSKTVGHEVHVRCVISVPGWEISAQSNPDVLLVNERNLAMLSGWRDQRDYLMNEDVDAVQQLLGARSTRFDARR
ncbi:MAG TPA: hypothetical protein VFE85_05830 [Woeseiaceae bacterium]|nr:hypothetical protein [Woeseiaceae bacterium]